MARGSGAKTGGLGSRGGNFVSNAIAAAKRGAAKIRARESNGSVAAEELSDARPASDAGEDNTETQRMDEDDDRNRRGASNATPKDRPRNSDADTPPTQEKAVARSLSGAMKAGADGGNNVEKLALERAKIAEYEARIEDLQRKMQSLEGQVSSLPPHAQKRGGARSEQRSPAKEPPFKKGWVDVGAEPWKKIFQLAGECF
jgi:hypothetical protein